MLRDGDDKVCFDSFYLGVKIRASSIKAFSFSYFSTSLSNRRSFRSTKPRVQTLSMMNNMQKPKKQRVLGALRRSLTSYAEYFVSDLFALMTIVAQPAVISRMAGRS